MIDYLKTYRRFVAARGTPARTAPLGPGMTHAEAKKRRLQGHHVVPKSLGGERAGNITYLSNLDHCVAHWLLNAGLAQSGRDPVPYIPNCTEEARSFSGNFSLKWNPLSKLRIRFWTDSGYEKTVTVTEAVRVLRNMALSPIRLSGVSKRTRRTLNAVISSNSNLMPYLLEICSRPANRRRYGHVWIAMDFGGTAR